MKKYLFLIISTLLIILLVGCENNISKSSSSKSNSSSNSKSNNTSTNTTKKSEVKSSTDSETNKKVTTTTKAVRLYYYNGVDDKIYYVDTTVNVKDDALVTAIIDALKTNYGDNYCTLDSGIQVKSANLDKSKNLLTVDFGTTFINNMNLGSGAESEVLQSIVNSLGYNFGVSNIIVSINGSPYSSGHIILEKGESLKVDYSNETKLK